MIQLGSADIMRMVWWYSRVWREMQEMYADTPGMAIRLLGNDETETVKNLIRKARRLAEPSGYHLEQASVERLAPDIALPWTQGSLDEAVVYVPLVSHFPRAILYEDIAATPLVPGQVVMVGANTARRTIANFGQWPLVNLVLTLRKESESRESEE